MKMWSRENIGVVAIIIAILSPLLMLAGIWFVQIDDQEELEIAVVRHTQDGHPAIVLAKIDVINTRLDAMEAKIDTKLGKSVFDQFQNQLFPQLDRIEKRLHYPNNMSLNE